MKDRSDRLTGDQVAAYLARIDVTSEGAPAVDHLRELQRQHLRTVPFENLSIHLAEPISLALDHLFAKIVVDRRGGFCYELNGLFAPTGYAFTGGGTPTALLRTLGYDVDLFACAVHGPRGLGPPFDHLALSVGVAGERTATSSTSASAGTARTRCSWTSGASRSIRTASSGSTRCPAATWTSVSTAVRSTWSSRGRVSSPTSNRRAGGSRPVRARTFRAGPVCSILTRSGGLLTLAGRQLISTEHGERTESTLASDADVLAAYRDRFGVRLPRVPVPVEGDQRHVSS